MINFYKFYNRSDLDNWYMSGGIRSITMLYGRNIGSGSKDEFDPVLHIIKKTPYLIYLYACDVLQYRWEEVEHILLRIKPEYEFIYSSGGTAYKVFNPNVLVWYTTNVIKRRWPEAEELMKHSIDWDSYVQWVGI